MADMAEPSVQAIDLTKRYGQFTALSKFNLKIEGSKCVGFLGPNGAGKTTTLKIFTDMIRPSEGKALINGIDVHRQKKKALENCGALIETPEIYPSLTAKEALIMIAEIKGIPRKKREREAESALSRVKMRAWADKTVGKFSKGMKQRINVAAALLGDPEVILLDEPTSGLDPRGMSEVRDIIKNLKRENKLIFLSSHLLNEVSEICDEVAMINHGKLLAYGKIEDIVKKFSKESTNIVEVSFSRPLANSVLHKIRGINGVSKVERSGQTDLNINVKGGIPGQEKLLSRLVSMKCGVIGFKPASSALEETYLNLFKEVT